jgi:hypothetical protein
LLALYHTEEEEEEEARPCALLVTRECANANRKLLKALEPGEREEFIPSFSQIDL